MDLNKDMKSYKVILTIFIGLLLLITMKACINYKRSQLAKADSSTISQIENEKKAWQSEEKFWQGNY
jgi:hypothetical protein